MGRALTAVESRLASVVAIAVALALPGSLAPAADQADFAGLVDIGGGRKIYLECKGAGSPTVLLISGQRASAGDWSIAAKPGPPVFPEVAKFTRVCAYDRPGTPVGQGFSRSDPVPQPTSVAGDVADLHALLAASGERPPYVLAAHSFGGLIARLYTSTYPHDVVGLVLIDVLSEGLREAETDAQWAIQRGLIEGDVTEDLKIYPAIERTDAEKSIDEMKGIRPLAPMPLVVLSADRPWGPQLPALIASGAVPASTPPDFGYVTDEAQKKAQAKLAELVPGAKHITHTNSGHEIHKEQPQLVIEAIRDVVDAVREGRKSVAPSGK